MRNAEIQSYRIAAVRHLPLATVRRLISKYTAGRGLGFSGEPGVNVLELNLALEPDRLSHSRPITHEHHRTLQPRPPPQPRRSGVRRSRCSGATSSRER